MHQLASALINRFQKAATIVLKGANGENFVLPAKNMVKMASVNLVATWSVYLGCNSSLQP